VSSTEAGVIEAGVIDTHEAPAPVASWDTEAGVLVTGKNALYSWLFYDGGEPRYIVGLHAPTQRQACESYTALGMQDPDSDYWYVALRKLSTRMRQWVS
jgi:hypothetical protein